MGRRGGGGEGRGRGDFKVNEYTFTGKVMFIFAPISMEVNH